MKIQDAAVRIVSAWEHTGHYDCHGDGAYGLIGWQWGELEKLLEAYVDAGGKLSQSPSWYANELVKQGQGQNAELNAAAKDPVMQEVQLLLAEDYMERAIQYQWQYYPFATATGQLIVCDIGVNSGIRNHYVEHAHYHHSDDEDDVLNAVLLYRRKALKDYGIWQKYEGIRRRWAFYDNLLVLLVDKNLSLNRTIDANGVQLDFVGDPIEPMKP